MWFNHNGKVLGINLKLAIDQRLTFEELSQIVERHKLRHDLFVLLKATKDKTLMRIIFNQLRENEFELQMLWGFDCNETYHRAFMWPHCTCPRLDNQDDFPFLRHINGACPLHGPDLI